MTESFNKKCIIETNSQLGRYVKAKEKLTAGEFVLLEQPIIIMAANGERRCNNCFKLAQSYCTNCQITNLCPNCTQHNQYECKLLASMANVDWNLLKRYSECYGIIKCLLLQENPDTKHYFDLMLQAESHLDERRGTEVWTHCNENIVGPILKSGITNSLPCCLQPNEDFLQRLCALIDVNGFEIRAPDCGSMKGVYVNGALLSHDCTANTQISIDDKYCMKIYANRDIDAGMVVTNCYTNVLLVRKIKWLSENSCVYTTEWYLCTIQKKYTLSL